MFDEEYEYDVEGLKRDIVNYLETEGYLNPVAYAEISEVENSDDIDFLIRKAEELGIRTDRCRY